MAKGGSPRSGAAPADVPRTHISGRPWVTVRPKYVGLPVRAGRGPDEPGRKPGGSGGRRSRPVPEARSRGPKSPPVERREASAPIARRAPRLTRAEFWCAFRRPTPLTLFRGGGKDDGVPGAVNNTGGGAMLHLSPHAGRGSSKRQSQVRIVMPAPTHCHARAGGHPVNTAVADCSQIRR
jgi:hypothetical protein